MNNASIITLVLLGCCLMFAGVLHDRSFKAKQRADEARQAQVAASITARHAAEDQQRQRINDNIQRIGDRSLAELEQQSKLAELWKGVSGPELRAKAEADLKTAQEEAYKVRGF